MTLLTTLIVRKITSIQEKVLEQIKCSLWQLELCPRLLREFSAFVCRSLGKD